MSDTVYAEDAAVPAPETPADALPERADVVVIGGGLTGLSAAYHLALAGRNVAVIEANGIGEGASGRNGGQLHPGQRRDQIWLTKHLGETLADELWELGEEAVGLVHTLRAEFGADCDFRPGLIDAAHTPAAFDDIRSYADHLYERYGVTPEIMDRAELAAAIGTERYVGGAHDSTGGHLNPLALVTALAEAAEKAGAHLFPMTTAEGYTAGAGGVTVTVRRRGARAHEIAADAVLLAGNGYLSGLEPRIETRVLPLVNHIAATEPLDISPIPGGEAVADTRAVIRYFRVDAENRLIFGGGESYGPVAADVAAIVRPYIDEVYPQLKDVPIAAAWSGTLGITRTRCPYIRRLQPGVYAAAGFSGQGLGLATFAGKVIAEAIGGDTGRLDVFAHMPVPPFPGGTRFLGPLAVLAMTWFSIRDRLALPQIPRPGAADQSRD